MSRSGLARWAPAACLWPIVALAPADAQVRRFGSEQTVLAVEIPVQVARDGKPVEGLTRDDFEVRDSGGMREIVDFEVVNLAVGAEGAGPLLPPVASAGRRYFLFLFDFSNSEPAALARARGAVKQSVLEALHPTDLAAVATWSISRGPQIVLGFTTDRRQVAAAIETLGVVEPWRRRTDPLGLLLADIERSAPDLVPGIASGATIETTVSERGLIDRLSQISLLEGGAARAARQGEISAFTRGFTALADLMSNVVGRKSVVLLSQGFDSTALLGTSDPEHDRAVADLAASGEIWDISSEERFGHTHLGNELERMLDAFRRADCTIEAIDVGGLAAASDGAAGRRPPGRETLLTMARDTGGHLFENFNDLQEAMARLLRATSVTYVLTIEPKGIEADGRFHEIRLRLKGAASGARASHRPGYFAPRPYDERAPADRQIETAQLLLTGEPGGELDGGVVAPAFRGGGGKAHVPVVVEMPGTAVLVTDDGELIPIAAYAYAFDSNGAVVDFVAQSFDLERAKVADRLGGGALKFVGDLLLPPGAYVVRALVRAGDDGAYWIGQLALEVPTFRAGELTLVAPLAREPLTSGLVVRNAGSAEKIKGLPFPFVFDGEFFLPTAMPALEREAPLTMIVPVYGLDTEPITFDVELRPADRPESPGLALDVELLSRRGPDAFGLGGIELRLRRPATSTGDLLLDLRATQGARTARVTTPIRLP